MYGGLLCYPYTSTYGNGVKMTTAYYGDSNNSEAIIMSVEIPNIHPSSSSTTPYDKATAFSAGNPALGVVHKIGKTYWLKASALTVSKGDKVVCSSSGLVIKEGAHTGGLKAMHSWSVVKDYSAATWIKGKYMGIDPVYSS